MNFQSLNDGMKTLDQQRSFRKEALLKVAIITCSSMFAAEKAIRENEQTLMVIDLRCLMSVIECFK